MKRRSKIGFAVLALALIGGGWLLFGPSNEPEYEGKPLSYWFRQCYANDSDYDVFELREAFKKMGTNALPYLVSEALSTNEDPAFKIKYYELLGKLPESWGMPQLVSKDEIRNSAKDALTLIDFSTKDVLPLLAKVLKETNTLPYKQAISILGNIGTNDAESLGPYFAKALHDADPDVQSLSLQALARMGSAARIAVPDMIELLNHPENTNSFFGAVAVLGNIRGDAAPAIPCLKDMFEKETNWWLRGMLARSLCQIDRQQNEALDFLVNGLKETNDPPSTPITPMLSIRLAPDEILESVGPPERSQFAAAQLGLIGSNALPAIPALIIKLDETDAGDELSVISVVLKKIGAPVNSYLPVLKQRLSSKKDSIRLAAARQILSLAPGDRETQSFLINLIRNHSTFKANAVYQLGRTGTNALADVIPALITALDEPRGDDWRAAAWALTKIHAPQGLILPKLKEKLKSPNDSVQLSADAAILNIDPADQDALANLMGLVTEKFSRHGICDFCPGRSRPGGEAGDSLPERGPKKR